MELPPTASGVQKYIDKGMWEKGRQVAKSVGNKQTMRKDLDNDHGNLRYPPPRPPPQEIRP